MNETITSPEARDIHVDEQRKDDDHDKISCWCCCWDCDFDEKSILAADRAAGIESVV